MNKGKVEQVGTPTDVYAAPANLFVAGFIGSPAMNMIPAEVVVHADGPHVIAAGASLPLDGCGDMACAPGARATFGVRPEDISLVPAGATAPATVAARVTIVEPLGPEFLLSFALNGHEIMAKIAGRALPRVGENLRFAFNMAHAHLFDAATGQSLRR